MKRIAHITALLPACLLAAGCYEDYVRNFDYSTIYSAYQYDLRTFVVGEGECFDFTVGLAGVLENDADRKVKVEISDALVTGDLPTVLGISGYSPFTAYDGMVGNAGFGTLSQSYVTKEVKALGVTALKSLPVNYYAVSGLGEMCISAGRHTDAVTVRATGDFLADPAAIGPVYAIGFHITSADADELPAEKSFEVIAVKYECKYFGYWYYGGESIIVDNITGKEISRSTYPVVLPQEDAKVYTLTTTGPYSVKTDKIAQKKGALNLAFNGEDVAVTCSDPSVTAGYCYTNDAKCIQDRIIYLNYSIDNGNGTTTIYKDYLQFRNRIRDGVSEWQDENPENYE